MNMNINQMCAFGVVNCIKTLWEERDLQDFTVLVDDELFHCHRFLLGACSPVFRGMFKSGMKEEREGLAKLQDISKDTFQSILTVLYTGRDTLTKSNFIDVWKAAHLLQIDFLVKHCEELASEFIEIDNFEKFNECAKVFGSKTVLKVTQNFIAKNFKTVKRTQGFMKLSSSELLAIVKRQDLVVSSEQIVIEAIMDWANYYKDDLSTEQTEQRKKINYTKCVESGDHKQNEKVCSLDLNNINGNCQNQQKKSIHDNTKEDDHKENDELTRRRTDTASRKTRLESLGSLLKSTRLCLASPHFLKKLYQNELVNSNHEAKNIIFAAVTYHLPNNRHGQWPSTAVHRDNSKFGHFGIIVTNVTQTKKIEAYFLGKKEWGVIKRFSNLDTIVSLEVFKNKLYAYGSNTNHHQTSYSISRLDVSGWTRYMTVPGQDASAILIAHGDFMYILCKEAKKLYRNDLIHQELMPLPPGIQFEFAFGFERNILAFYDSVVNDNNETCVYSLDISAKKWTQCVGFEGTAKHMISFRDDNDTYILQADGSLQVVTSELSGVIEFRFLAKLWDFNKVLHGALTYNDCLIIFENHPDSDPVDKTMAFCLPGRFKQISYWGDDTATSNFVPAILLKSLFSSSDKEYDSH